MKLVSGIVAAVLAATSIPAAAQLAPGTSGFSSAPVSASEAEYWIMVRKLGNCLADAKRPLAVALLATRSGTAEEDAAFKPLFHRNSNRCMGNFVRASIIRAHIRGAIAEGLFEQLVRSRSGQAVALTPSQPDAIASLHDFARCYVAVHPDVAQQFIAQTKLGSEGEAVAIRQMAVDFQECLPAGRQVTLNPIEVRMAIAEALYHAANRPVTNQVAQ